MINGLDQEFQDIALRGEKHPAAQTYRRFAEWVDFHNRYLTQTTAHAKCGVITPKNGLTPGIDAATNWMGLTLKMIQQRFRRDVSPLPDVAEMQKIALGSYPFLGKLASLDLLTFNCIGFSIAELEDPQSRGEIDTDAFVIKANRRALGLDFSPKGENAIAEREEKMQNQINNIPRIGCPALVNFGKGPVVLRLWNKYVEISPEIFAQNPMA